MTVFYRGPCAHITHEVFESRCPYHRRYMIRDIRQIYLARRARDAAYSDRRVSSAGMAGVAAVAVALGGPALGAASMPPAAAAGLVTLLVLVVLSSIALAACLRVQPGRVYELWAFYRGELTCLFRTADERVFGQVKRALVRAIEQLDDGVAVARPRPFPRRPAAMYRSATPHLPEKPGPWSERERE
jgi:Family of unknown function (DUF6232)